MIKDAQAGGNTDLLSSILEVTVRNEEKITERDRDYCQTLQERLYKTLDQLDYWYAVFKTEADKYAESKGVTYAENGSIEREYNLYKWYSEGSGDYAPFEFLPFKEINRIVESRCKAICAFANDIIRYFNRTYRVNVDSPDIDKEKLPMGFMPTYQTYVDAVIGHLGGKGFREMAEEELMARFHKSAIRSRDKTPEIKGDKIIFYDVLYYSKFTWETHYSLESGYRKYLSDLCSGVVFALCGDIGLPADCIQDFDSTEMDLARWYNFFVAWPLMIKFYKNGRVDIKFEDAPTAERCFRKLRLNDISAQ